MWGQLAQKIGIYLLAFAVLSILINAFLMLFSLGGHARNVINGTEFPPKAMARFTMVLLLVGSIAMLFVAVHDWRKPAHDVACIEAVLGIAFSTLVFFGWPRSIVINELGIFTRDYFGRELMVSLESLDHVERISNTRGYGDTYLMYGQDDKKVAIPEKVYDFNGILEKLSQRKQLKIIPYVRRKRIWWR